MAVRKSSNPTDPTQLWFPWSSFEDIDILWMVEELARDVEHPFNSWSLLCRQFVMFWVSAGEHALDSVVSTRWFWTQNPLSVSIDGPKPDPSQYGPSLNGLLDIWMTVKLATATQPDWIRFAVNFSNRRLISISISIRAATLIRDLTLGHCALTFFFSWY